MIKLVSNVLLVFVFVGCSDQYFESFNRADSAYYGDNLKSAELALTRHIEFLERRSESEDIVIAILLAKIRLFDVYYHQGNFSKVELVLDEIDGMSHLVEKYGIQNISGKQAVVLRQIDELEKASGLIPQWKREMQDNEL